MPRATTLAGRGARPRNGEIPPVTDRTLLVVGASGHASVVCDLAEGAGYTKFVFLDDRFPVERPHPFGPIAGPTTPESMERFVRTEFVVAIGNCAVRDRLFRSALDVGLLPTTLIHPKALVSRHADIGPGSVVFAGAIVAAFARTGLAAIINHGATLDHDCELDDAVHVCPGAHLSGGVRVGRRSWIGVGAAVRQGITIGADVTVGAAAAVVADIPDGWTVAGIPARPLGRP